MGMARGSPGQANPERFYAAATYAGLDGSSSNTKGLTSRFPNDVALLLYALYQQATVGPCNIPKARGWSPTDQSKWNSWHGLGNMPSKEAMRLFVKILEEEDPGWFSRMSNSLAEPVMDLEINYTSDIKPILENRNSFPEIRTVATENGITQEKVISEGLGSVKVYDQWISPPISGKKPRVRYEHGAAILHDKMYIFGGNHNGRYLGDLHALDLRNWTWSKIEANSRADSEELKGTVLVTPTSGHSLIPWENKLLSIAGHMKEPFETIQVKAFDVHTKTWSTLKTYGKAPASRGGQSVTLVGTSLVIFGGQDAKRSFLNDLYILDLESMTWDEIDPLGIPPPPRSHHASAIHAEQYLLIFGGGSHATCFNDLHVLDLQTMEWSRPVQQGDIPAPRAGHTGVTIGENWFIVGGGDTKSGVSETIVLNMSTLVWSVVTSTRGQAPVASEGLSLVVSSYNGEDVLVAFGGYNGHYSNEVNVLKPSHLSTLQSNMMETRMADSVSAVYNASYDVRDVESEIAQDGNFKEISMDYAKSNLKKPNGGTSGRYLVTALKVEKEELESLLSKEKLLTLQLKHKLSDAETRHIDLYEELQSVRNQLGSEQSRCFKLEVEVAELRQKLQALETLEKELELLQRQKTASEQAALSAMQRRGSGSRWSWLTSE